MNYILIIFKDHLGLLKIHFFVSPFQTVNLNLWGMGRGMYVLLKFPRGSNISPELLITEPELCIAFKQSFRNDIFPNQSFGGYYTVFCSAYYCHRYLEGTCVCINHHLSLVTGVNIRS